MWRRVLTERPNVLKSASVVPTVVQATEASSIRSLFPIGTRYPSRKEIGCCATCPCMTTGTGLDALLTAFAFAVVAFGSAFPGSENPNMSAKAEAAAPNACLFQNMAGVRSGRERCPSNQRMV
jgi:hypothetical protein